MSSGQRRGTERVTRRQFLRHLDAGIGVAAVGSEVNVLSGCAPGVRVSTLQPTLTPAVDADVELALRAAPAEVQILLGAPT